MKELVKFHADHKYLLLSYNQSQSRLLGKIVANHEKKPFREVADLYEYHLGLAFARLPSRSNYINTFMVFRHHSFNHLNIILQVSIYTNEHIACGVFQPC